MKTVKIKLNSPSDVVDFSKKAEMVDSYLDLSKRSVTVDAKSVMGVLSLDISEPLVLTVYNDDADLTLLERYFV